MTTKETGGPAFPHGDPTNGGDLGMTLRDYFAAAVMPSVYTQYWEGVSSMQYKCEYGWQEGIAGDAYAMADAMLKARQV